MENLPKIVAERLKVAAAAGHPDANILTAFAEKSLSTAEREDVLRHLAGCGECREVVALALPAVEQVQPTLTFAHRGWPALRWGLALAGIVVVASLGTVLYRHQGAESRTTDQVPQSVTEAKNVAPAAQPAEPAKGEAAKTGGAEQVAGSAADADNITPRAKKAFSGGADEAKRDLKAPAPLPHGPRTTNQLNQWQQTANGITAGGPVPSAPSPPAAKQAEGQLVANQASPEAVQVESASPLLEAQPQTQETLVARNVPTSPPARSGIADARVDKAKPADTVVSMGAPKVPAPYQAGAVKLASAGIPVWSIDSAGRLERSFDQGTTFQQVDVKASPVAARFNALAKSSEVAGKKDVTRNEAQSNPPIVFRAVASNGMEVWAGGSAGELYHSTDAGTRWSRVTPSSAGVTLTGDIIGIDFPDALHGTITTSTPETWTTSDDGVTWQKQ